MNIHIQGPEGGLTELCKSLEISEEHARRINGIKRGEAAPGEELLGLVPTRSYRTVYGDTLEKISLRFGVSRRELLLANPHLATREPKIGESVTLKYGDRCHGMRVANGYFHEGTSDEKLLTVLPFLTYVTFCSAVADRHGVRRIMQDKGQLKTATNAGKVPLVRVHDLFTERFKKGDTKGFGESLIDFATKGGYRGILLNATSFSDSAEEYSLFLKKLRKLMIGHDLILITEIDENSPVEFSDNADGSVLYYPKYAMERPPSFADGERKVLADFATRGESSKTFVDLSCLAKHQRGYCSIDEALELARRNGYVISQNESTLLSHFTDRKQGEFTLPSLTGLRAIFDLICEFDYMGICFDIMRVPMKFLMLYNAIFKTCYQASGGM